MACVHNQAKINELNNLINSIYNDIDNLSYNVEMCRNIQIKHKKFNDKINCVNNKLASITVVAGVPYDYGMMGECLDGSNKTINICDEVIEQSLNKVEKLKDEIMHLRDSIASLQGNCYACSVENEKYGKE